MPFEIFCIMKGHVTNVASVGLLMDVDHVLLERIMLLHKFVAYRALKLRVWLVIVRRHMFLDFAL